MNYVISKLTILFEEPFWIGIYERESNGQYEVCKIMFGPEPKDYQINEFIIKNWSKLRFSTSTEVEVMTKKIINPKRMQRMINQQLKNTGIGTKAQQALKQQKEQGKLERRICSREQKEHEKKRRFELKQNKRNEKHRGH